jgi:small subunit ribosomal protein S33
VRGHVLLSFPLVLLTLKRKMASVAPSRLATLTRLSSVIFQTSYNPTSQRTGAKYLKRRLRGPSMMDYYPYQLSISAINKEFNGLDLVDEYEEQRLQDVADKKKRGKGAPKKAKSAGMVIVCLFCTSSPFFLQPTVAVHKESAKGLLIVLVFAVARKLVTGLLYIIVHSFLHVIVTSVHIHLVSLSAGGASVYAPLGCAPTRKAHQQLLLVTALVWCELT